MLQRKKRLYLLTILLFVLQTQIVMSQSESNPFFEPIENQNLAAIEYLIRQGIDVNKPNAFGLSPLEFAIRAHAVASAQLLHKYGASFSTIDPSVIQEFRYKPGIGPFLERYALSTNVALPSTAINSYQTITQQPIVQTPRQSQVISPVANLQIAPNTLTYQNRNVQKQNTNFVENLRQPNTIGNTAQTASSFNQPYKALVTTPTRPIGLQTITLSPVSPSIQNTSYISASSQSVKNREVENQPLEKVIASLSLRPDPEELDQSVKVENMQSKPTEGTDSSLANQNPDFTKALQQVHYDNRSNVCEVKNQNLVVTFMFDDGEATDLDVIDEVFRPRSVTGTLGIILDRINSNDSRYMNATQISQLYEEGWEIASHTSNHKDLTTLATDSLDNDLLQSYKGFGALGFDVSSLVYPYGANNRLVRDYTSRYYYGAFEGEYRLNTPKSDPLKLQRFHIANVHDFDYYKRVTDTYSDNFGWLVWTVHTGLNFGDQQVDDLQQLLDYMCEQGIQTVTTRTGLNHLDLVD